MKKGTGAGKGGHGNGNAAANKLQNTTLSVPRKPPQQVQNAVNEIVTSAHEVEVEDSKEPELILDAILNEEESEQFLEQYSEEVADDENLDYEGTYEDGNTGAVEGQEGDDPQVYQEIEGVDGGILTGLKYDPLLPPLNDDPRDGKRIKKKGKGRNTESFDPSTTLVRPDMRILVGPNADTYGSVLKHDDVVIVPDFFCQRDDWSLYYKLIDEMRYCQSHGEKDAEWISWHEGSHLISKNPNGSQTYHEIQSKIAQYFNIPMQSVGTRFNWYRNSTDWKPFHHDSAAYNHQRAQNQNITVGVSFGSTRELAFLNVKNGTKIYFPQTNGMMFSFGRDVNIQWKHGVNALPDEEQDGRGRVSIILWGMADVVEEKNSPPMVCNAENFGGVQRDRRPSQFNNNHSHPPHGHGPPPIQMNAVRTSAPPPALAPRGGERPLFILSEDRERLERERDRDRQRDWERDRGRRDEWERQRAQPYGRSRSRSRERRMYPPPGPPHHLTPPPPIDFHRDRDRSLDRRDRGYFPPPSAPPPLTPLPGYAMPPRDYPPPREDRGRLHDSNGPPRIMTGDCFQFVNTGTCRFGDNCRFRHIVER